MDENFQTIERPGINHGREEPVVYVTEDRRVAEELATEFGYGVVVQKKLRRTPRGKATIQEFIVVPHHKKHQ